MCCDGGRGGRRGMIDREEQVIYDTYISAQQHEASYDNVVR